ncbi:MAG: hypothetical protein M1360_04825 [Candidatus Marsarchaeota archaeon]|jgi:hypothetical protein|nr:hypothetical protein [Candidatus Marsarchaeota archaeon]MCL5419228.1 hypothetical protein [Candidatus Marsarchaeota archaeon]
METNYNSGEQDSSNPDSFNISVPPIPSASQASTGNTTTTMQPQVSQARLSPSGTAIKAIAAIVVLALISYLAYYIIHGASSSSSNPVIAMLAAHKPVNFLSAANTMFNYVNKTKQLNVSYNGSASLVMSSALTGSVTLSMPVQIVYEKYYNISRISASLKGVPLVGNLSFVEIANRSVRYSCTNTSSLSLLAGASGFKCTKSTQNASVASISTASITSINTTYIEKELNITIEGVKEASYNKQSCYLMEGAGKVSLPSNFTSAYSLVPLSSGPDNFTYNISSCVSLQYGLPLNISISIASTNKTSPTKIAISLNEVSLNTNTNPSIATLPGPIVNTSLTSGLGSGYGTGTVSTSQQLSCIAQFGYACQNQSLVGDTFSATVGQSTGSNWPYAVICLTPSNYTIPYGSTPSTCPLGSASYVLINGLNSGQLAHVSFNASNFIIYGNIYAQLYALYGSSANNITGNAYMGFVTGSGPAYDTTTVIPTITTTISSASTAPSGNVTNPNSYQYSGIYNGSAIILTYTPPRTIEDLPDAVDIGMLSNFYTSNPEYECLNGESLNVWVAPSEYPGYYIVHNGDQGTQCAYVTLLFKQ